MLQMKIILLKFLDLFGIRYTLEFSFQEHMLLVQDPSTNWSLIKYFASLYDPLGLFNPYIVQLKILFQKVCKVGISWDQTIPLELICEWEQILEYNL